MAADDVGPPGVTTGMGRVEGRLNVNGFGIEKCKQTPPPNKNKYIFLYIGTAGKILENYLKYLCLGVK